MIMTIRTGRKLAEVSVDERIRNLLESAYNKAGRPDGKFLEDIGERISGFIRTDSQPPAANTPGIGHRYGMRFRVGITGREEVAISFPTMGREERSATGSYPEIRVFASSRVSPMAINSLLRKIEAAMKDVIVDTRNGTCLFL